MTYEWPLLGNEAEVSSTPAPPLLQLSELTARIRAGQAIDAIAAKRALQILTHGHTPEKDLEKPIGLLALEAKARLDALTEIVGGVAGRMNLPRDRREQCLRYVEIAGGIILSLWDRCQVEVPE
jgi:hypothetical protein